MKNDGKILKCVMELNFMTDTYVKYVTSFNECATTARMLDEIVEKAEEIKKLCEENFKEGR